MNAYVAELIETSFGKQFALNMTDRLVIVLQRGAGGWQTPHERPHVSMAHQIYWHQIEPITHECEEIVAVGLNTGTWRTLWASSPSQITHAG